METEPLTPTFQISNDTIKSIYERRAVRKYKSRSLTKKLIEQILDAGRMAPTAMNKQSWKFYVVTDKETIQSMSKAIKKIAAQEFLKVGFKKLIKAALSLLRSTPSLDFFKTDDPVFYNAPLVIFITTPKDNEWGALDAGMCAQNMMLAGKSLGLDSCPVGFGRFLEHTKNYSLLGAGSKEQLHLALVFGYGDEQPVVHKRNRNNATFIN